MKKICILFALVFMTIQAQKQPNIIFILADDMGWGDTGFNGQEKIKTPNIDALAKEGMILNNFYAGSPVCGPSRAILMTGKHSGHSFIRNNPSQAKSKEAWDLRPEDNTIPKELKKVGYATGLFGKWGLDEPNGSDAGHPFNQGFDRFYGMLTHQEAHFHWAPYVWDNDKKVDWGGKSNWTEKKHYADTRFTEKAIEFIDEKATEKKPFFVYLSYLIPHLGITAPKEAWTPYENLGWKNGGGKKGHYHNDPNTNVSYAAMITLMDNYIGQVRDKLVELGIAENTLIVFSSDNGHEFDNGFFNSSGGHRGRKRDLYEGGIKVPTLAYWPKTIKAGQVNNDLHAFWDMLPTFAELAGNKVTDTDGVSLAPLFKGKTPNKHEYLYWEFNKFSSTPQQALRFGDWKAYTIHGSNKIEIYNLKKDPKESNDVSASEPELVQKAKELFVSARTDNPNFPLTKGAGKSKGKKGKGKKGKGSKKKKKRKA